MCVKCVHSISDVSHLLYVSSIIFAFHVKSTDFLVNSISIQLFLLLSAGKFIYSVLSFIFFFVFTFMVSTWIFSYRVWFLVNSFIIYFLEVITVVLLKFDNYNVYITCISICAYSYPQLYSLIHACMHICIYLHSLIQYA